MILLLRGNNNISSFFCMLVYVLMGISSYLIYRDDGIDSDALGVY